MPGTKWPVLKNPVWYFHIQGTAGGSRVNGCPSLIMKYRYNAFISYSHAADGKLAPAIQSALHHLAKPWYKMRALWVFRDKTSLAATPALWPSIEMALSDAEYFILLASPRAAQSKWVQQEIQWWLSNRPVDKLLIALTEGELTWDNSTKDFDWNNTNAIPTILQHQFQGEPLYVDLHWAKTEDNLSLRHSQFRGCILDLAAPLHGKPKEDLDGEDVCQYRKTRHLANAAITAISVLAIGIGISAYAAFTQSIQAQVSSIDALNNLSVTSFNANKQLEGLVASIKAVTQLNALNSGLSGFAQKVFPSKDRQEASAMSVATLHQALSNIHEYNRLEGHSDGINRVIFSSVCPDGKQLIASASKDRSIKLWDHDGTLIETRTPMKHNANVTAISFSPDCQLLASASDKTIKLWKRDGTFIWKVIDDAEVKSVSFSPNGQYLASANLAGQIILWNLQGQKLKSIQAHDAEIKNISFSPRCPNGKQLLSRFQQA